MWMAAGCVFILLMGTLSYIQFFDTESLKDNPWNSRSLYDNYGANRGSIVVDGTEIASSVKSDDEYNYQRVYSEPEKYAALTGYFSSVYGSTGVESAMDKELSGYFRQPVLRSCCSALLGFFGTRCERRAHRGFQASGAC